MSASFLAILIHTPSQAAWLSSSHSSHSAGEAKGIFARPSSAPTRGTLAGQRYVLGIVLRAALEGEEVVVPAPDGAGKLAADARPVLVYGALPRLRVEELAAGRKELVPLVAQDRLSIDLLRVLLTYVGDRLAETLGKPPDVSLGDRRSRIRAAVG